MTKNHSVEKYKMTLSPNDILAAFPDEAKELVPGLLARARSELCYYAEAKQQVIEDDSYDENTRAFLLKIWDLWTPREIVDRVKRLSVLRMIMSSPRGSRGILAEDVRGVPILSIAPLSRVREYANKAVALCPFHEEDTPSLHIDKEKNLFHCFGCNAGGDAIAFAQKYYRLNFKDALHLLKNRA